MKFKNFNTKNKVIVKKNNHLTKNKFKILNQIYKVKIIKIYK